MEKDQVCPVIDVRSPAEYQHAHIPGAFSIPLFDNLERAEIGTLYKKAGKEIAVEKGLEFVGPKMKTLVEEAKNSQKQRKLWFIAGAEACEALPWLGFLKPPA